MIIQAQRNDSLITSNIVIQKIGAWSYSIYLWHWPLVVAIYYFSLNENFIYMGLILSVLLGFLSNKYIEKIKFRIVFNHPLSYFKCQPMYFLFIIGVLGGVIFLSNGFDRRISPLDVPNINANETYKHKFLQSEIELSEDECRLYEEDDIPHGTGCEKLELNGYSDIKAIILGDSHAGSIAPGVLKSLHKINEHSSIINARASGCIPLLGVKHRNGAMFSGCDEYNSYLYEKLNSGVVPFDIPVIIISRLNLYPYGFVENGEENKPFIWLNNKTRFDENYKSVFKNRFMENICSLSDDRNVYLMRPVPEFKFDVNNAISSIQMKGSSMFSDKLYLSQSDYDLRNKFMNSIIVEVEKKCNINILNPLEYLISDKGYLSVHDGVSIYSDASHFNYNGALLISPLFDKIWL